MKVICLSNKKPLEKNHNLTTSDNSVNPGLELGNYYQVYGLIIIEGALNVYICDKIHQNFPVFYPINLFNVIDHHLSRFWVYNCIEGEKIFPAFLFPEAFDDIYFFDKLTDGEQLKVGIFKKYKELMDLEFPDPTISQTAQLGDDKWLICPDCTEAWENAQSLDALVKCPQCLKIFNNPRYQARSN